MESEEKSLFSPDFTPRCMYIANLCLNLALFVAFSWEYFETHGFGLVLPLAASNYLLLLVIGSLVLWKGIRNQDKLFVLIGCLWIYDMYVSWKVLENPISNDVHGRVFLKGIHLVKLFTLIKYGLLMWENPEWEAWEDQHLDTSSGE